METRNKPQSVGEAVARLRLDAEWTPDTVVLNAITEWLSEALNDQSNGIKARLALRWCKWQRLMTPANANFARRYTECFAQFYRIFGEREHGSGAVSPFINLITSSELESLDSDLEIMKKYKRRFDYQLRNSKGHVSSCERHLWGPITDEIGGAQSHFWELRDPAP